MIKYLYKMFLNKDEKPIFLFFVFSVIIFIISLIQVPICECIHHEVLKIIFLSDAIKTISGGIISAYILYVFVELKPKYEKEKNTLFVLNKTIASVMEGFFVPNIFQHEKSIRHAKFEMKSSNEKIQEAIQNIKDKEVDYLQLKIAMQTAHSRYSDFQNLLTLAVNLSPDYGLYWLDLIDKIRLLADEMENQIDNPDMNILHDLKSINSTMEKNPTASFCSSLMFRVMEFFESVIEWNNRDKKVLIKSNE